MKSKPKVKIKSKVKAKVRSKRPARQNSAQIIAELRNELENAQETLRAIQNGEVDALVVSGPEGEKIFTLETADLPYRILVETMSEGAATLGADGLILFCNRQFSEMLGLAHEKIVGVSLSKFVLPENQVAFEQAFQQATLTKARCPLTLKHTNLGETSVLMSMSAVKLEIGAGVCLVATDLTEQKQFEQSRAEIEKLNVERELRERFVSTLSHDLRNPLTAVKTSAQMIIRYPNQGEKHQVMGARIVKAIDRADKMIQNLLDANRIRAGERLPLDLEKCDLKQTAEEAVNDLAITYGPRFVVKSKTAIEGIWSGEQLRRVVENLALNAVKYGSDKEPIAIQLNKDHQYAYLSVHNFGNPIPMNEQQSLFNAYARSASAQKSGKMGWGLGLTLVRGVVEAHGGKISVESNPERGTTFTVVLPNDARPYQNEVSS